MNSNMSLESIYGNLPIGWSLTTIGQLVNSGDADIQTGPFGTMLHAESYTTSGKPVVAVKHLGDNRLLHEDLPRIGDADSVRLARYMLREGDIVFGRKGAVERRAYVTSSENGWLQGSDCIRVRFTSQNINAKYVSFVLGSSAYRKWIERNAHGATMPSLNQEIIGRIPLPIPSLSEQRAIAHILGTLNDKIELNRRMNEILEAIARAIFKSWFVDFDPVHAKAEGREPAGMDAEMAALFPDRFEETEMGMVPKGWITGTVGKDFDLTMGQSPPGDTYNEIGDGMAFYQGRADFGFRYPFIRMYCTEPTRKANPGDTLVSVRAPVGDINMALDKCCIGRGLSAIRHKSGSRSFTYYSMLSLREIFAKFEAEGTVFGSINKKDFEAISWIIPQAKVVENFEDLTRPLDQMIENKENESRILASMRDTLLTKLISGQIHVNMRGDVEEYNNPNFERQYK